eukprot:Nitzschia sp. Nitz4//scaffold46_size129759//35068//37423//NITZ4_003492-RA/size129759-augustus-gene-0.18-mRNA-1//-1//CDS//3329552568//177//frame0
MSGMSLLHSFGSDQLKSNSEGKDNIDSRRAGSSGDSVQSTDSGFGGVSGKGSISRPPGLGISVPSPIGKLGHSYTSSASTAQNLTLTPTSSLDGGELYGRQASPFQGDGPSMSSDYNNRYGSDESELPPGIADFGGFDGDDGEHDGLLGLQALRNRAQSVPGLGQSSNSPSQRQYGGFDDGRNGGARPRAVSRDNGRTQSLNNTRPPLSGGLSQSPHTGGEHKTFQPNFSSGNRSRDHSPTPTGVISRPGNVFDPPERLYGDVSRNNREYGQGQYGDRNQSAIDQMTQQFGHMGGFSQGQNQNMRHGQHGFQRQQRSSSLPGPIHGIQPDFGDEPLYQPPTTRRGSDFGIGMTSRLHTNSEDFGEPRYGSPQYSYGQDMAPPTTQRRSSLQGIPGAPGFYGQSHGHNVHRRESLDFVPGHNRYPDGVPVVASNEEMRMYGGQGRMSSSSQSPLHSQYGNPSMGGGQMRGVRSQEMYGGPVRRGSHMASHSDEDFTNALLGLDAEDYQDLAEHSNPHVRNRRPSMEQPLPQYSAANAHMMSGGVQSPLAPPKVVYNVKFKRTQRTFVLGPRLNRDLKVGTYVKVEADRGEDLGIVVGKAAPEKFSGRSSFRGDGGMASPSPAPVGSADLKRIIRLATHDEVSLLQLKREEEDELLRICRTKVKQRALPMNVVDAEYQFDRHKLTFFFEAEGRVDFRELVRDLFSMYKTRIWMQQLDKSTSATCPAAPEEPQQVVMDLGTPIMAPESEYSEFAAPPAGEGSQ